MDALLVFCDLGHTLVSMQYDFPLRRVAREILYSVHLMFRLRSFVKRKSFKNIILSVFVAIYHKSHTLSQVSPTHRLLKYILYDINHIKLLQSIFTYLVRPMYFFRQPVGVSPVSSKKRRLKFEAFPYPQARRIDATL